MRTKVIWNLVAIFIIRWVKHEEEFYVKYKIEKPVFGFIAQLEKNFKDEDPIGYEKARQRYTDRLRKEYDEQQAW